MTPAAQFHYLGPKHPRRQEPQHIERQPQLVVYAVAVGSQRIGRQHQVVQERHLRGLPDGYGFASDVCLGNAGFQVPSRTEQKGVEPGLVGQDRALAVDL